MYANMDRAARDFLHCVIREQRAATDELLASNRELQKLLEEVLASRTDLKDLIESEVDTEEAPAACPKDGGEAVEWSVSQLKREVDFILQKGGQAIRDSSRLRQRSKKIRELLRDKGPRGAPNGPAQGLSKREHQVLSLMVAGKSSKEIAAELGISFKTAVTHRASIMSKLDVHEIASVVREAIRRGLV